MKKLIIKTDCKYFRGDIPCSPHKILGVKCENCREYHAAEEIILIIKLGAIGDVIRTTPLLRKIRSIYPTAYIFWLTYTPEIISQDWVERPLNVSIENIEFLKNMKFDILYNLDKDPLAIALANSIHAVKKVGFTIDKYGHAIPIGSEAEYHKWLTGLFDDLNKSNTKNYMEEIFEISGFNFEGEEYILEIPTTKYAFDIDKSKKVIGLNTGCGGRWTSRLWPVFHWEKLITLLLNAGYEVILLGGEQEHEKNSQLQMSSGAKYFGYFPLRDFMVLMSNCDLIVSAVSMSMHLALGLGKKLILFNNIFNKNEFYLYNRGEILEPDIMCDCYYTPSCPNNCMKYLVPNSVFTAIEKWIK